LVGIEIKNETLESAELTAFLRVIFMVGIEVQAESKVCF